MPPPKDNKNDRSPVEDEVAVLERRIAQLGGPTSPVLDARSYERRLLIARLRQLLSRGGR